MKQQKLTNRENFNEGDIVDATHLAPLLSMNVSQILRLQRQAKIPSIKLGHRTMRFSVSAVMSALMAA